MRDVVYTDGDWELVENSYSKGYKLIHICDATGNSPWHFRNIRYRYRTLKVPCRKCGSRAPEGLQGLYVMMTGDMEV